MLAYLLPSHYGVKLIENILISTFFYSSVLLNHVSPSQPDPTFRDGVGVLVQLGNILLTLCVVTVVYLCKLPIYGSDKTVFPPIFHTRLKINFKHSCCLITNIAYLPYIAFLGYQCVAPRLLSCSLTLLGQTAEYVVVMKLSNGTSTSVGITASYFADNM